MLHFTTVMHDSCANVNFAISNCVLERHTIKQWYLMEWLYVIARVAISHRYLTGCGIYMFFHSIKIIYNLF